ncbi:MAG: hypothetical protein DRP85_00815 [Candidatus Makaraimicrobium thalassicum]|nr:MAG: hypothetical protein DRP85_00815 [Candidatus Omnitrophota bacterium]
MAAEVYYGNYQFLPAPLITYSIAQEYDEKENLIYRTITYGLNGTLLFPSGDFGVIMQKRQELEDALSRDNEVFKIVYNGDVLVSGCPRVNSLEFTEGVWVDRIDYTAELFIKESGAIGNIETYSETWSYEENEDRRTITVEHNISAKGLNTATSGNNALENARDFVLSKVGYNNAPSFMPAFTEGSGALQPYESFRVENADTYESTYEVTEKFILSSGTYIHVYNASYSVNENGSVNVDIDGEIRGLGRGDAAYQHALEGWANVLPRLPSVASGVYLRYGGTRNLSQSPRSLNLTENKFDGIITYDVSFVDDVNALPSGIISFELVKEIDEPVTLYATHTIVDKPDGPVVQDLGTSTEGYVTIRGRAQKKSDYPLYLLKDFINARIAAAAPTGYGTSYRVVQKTYSIDDSGDIVEFSIRWAFTAPAYNSYLTYL